MSRFPLIACLCLLPHLLCGELPPSAYEAMQAAATEHLMIEVLRVDIEAGDVPEQQKVHLTALVSSVTRTANNLKAGEVLSVTYAVTDRPKGWAGPGEIPILSEKDKTVAYLAKIGESPDYRPAAGAMSFRNF